MAVNDSTSTPPPTTDVAASADGARIASEASRAVTTTPRASPCPPFMLTRFIDQRTGEIVRAFYRLCNGQDEYLDLSNASIGGVAAP